ncbi:putative outer membrane protein [Melaminivora alkalimesophila]|uniref:Putative outer membrane protein n=2 Tax=Melaminivora alkalimesophila TaxID=1165852 RepID=A0A317RDY5_9BURK|nr:DUF4142 domain-containing protein [Melaminivora alkalimesophila]PWW45551.1 putative outer membrane protein [Melaminivora alkalimesophila]
MPMFCFRSTVALAAAAGLGLTGASWAQGTPPVIAPPASSITSPDTAPADRGGTSGDRPVQRPGGTAAPAGTAPAAPAPAAPATAPARTPAPAAPAQADGKPAHADAAFMNQAAQNGHLEVEAARLALQKSQNPEVREFAQRMIDDHTKAAQELGALATAKNHSLPDGPSLLQKGKLKLLGTHGDEKFDRSYIEDLGPKAHRETIELFEKGAREAHDPDVRAYAEKTLPTLREHLSMAEKLDRDTRSERKGTTR